MQDVNRLKQLKDQIVGIEMTLDLIRTELIAVESDITFLENHACLLRENLIVLKSDKIIAVASEYRLVVSELKAVEENLTIYQNLRVDLNLKNEKHIKMRDATLLEYEELKKQLDGRKVLLLFDPSKRKHEG